MPCFRRENHVLSVCWKWRLSLGCVLIGDWNGLRSVLGDPWPQLGKECEVRIALVSIRLIFCLHGLNGILWDRICLGNNLFPYPRDAFFYCLSRS